LVEFTNSDWVGNPDDQKSNAGYVFILGSRPITWSCKKQQYFTLYSAKVEYQTMVNTSSGSLVALKNTFKVWIPIAASDQPLL
jgi:hypothetical protein